MPGRCLTAEVVLYRTVLSTLRAVGDKPPWAPRDLFALGFAVGYATAVLCAGQCLVCWCSNMHSPRECRDAEAFALRCIDLLVPAARSLQSGNILGEEIQLVDYIVTILKIPVGAFKDAAAQDFWSSLRAKWSEPELVTWSRERRLIPLAIPHQRAGDAQVEAQRRADLAENGLKRCALASCNKKEDTVGQLTATSCGTAATSTASLTGRLTRRSVAQLRKNRSTNEVRCRSV